MSLTVGIVGLPNVGKSTIFNALSAGKAAASNYPFCTIEPNNGIVAIPDQRLERLSKISPAEKNIPAFLEMVDIAGLVKNASKGEGLGNQFLSHIRNVDAIVHVVRCFEDPDVVHVDGAIDPQRDVETVETELLLKDLETVEKWLEKAHKAAKSGNKDDKSAVTILEQAYGTLSEGKTPAFLTETSNASLADLRLLSTKPVVYLANIGETDYGTDTAAVQALKERAATRNAPVVPLCGRIEAELMELPENERTEFLAELGIPEPGLHTLARTVFDYLHLETFFTYNEKENHAWPISRGTTAPKAAGKIHTDFERGFIKVEVYRLEDLETYRSQAEVRSAGKMHLQGADYIVQDGDILQFKFNV